jgi:hypothetical protein
MDSHYCPACKKAFKSQQGRNAHLRSAASCAWYRSGKNPVFQYDVEETEGGSLDIGLDNIDYMDDMPPGDVQEDMEDIFQFIPADGAAIPEAGPSNLDRSRHVPDAIHLEQEDDKRVEDIAQLAGLVIRMDKDLHTQWRSTFGQGQEDVDMDADNSNSNQYAPFASEMDWKIAQWVVNDGPGHAAFDRLLAIPQVSHYRFFTSAHCLSRARFGKDWAFHTKTYEVYTNWWTTFQHEQRGKVETCLSTIGLMRNIAFTFATQSRQSAASGGIQNIQKIWFMHQERSFLIQEGKIVYIQKCGQDNFGMGSKRYIDRYSSDKCE